MLPTFPLPSLAVPSQLISKANSRCQRQCETSEARRQSKQRRVYATWCAFVLTSLPIYPPHKQSTPHNNGQYIQTCVQPAEGSGECWLPLLFDIYLPFPPNHKDAAAHDKKGTEKTEMKKKHKITWRRVRCSPLFCGVCMDEGDGVACVGTSSCRGNSSASSSSSSGISVVGDKPSSQAAPAPAPAPVLVALLFCLCIDLPPVVALVVTVVDPTRCL